MKRILVAGIGNIFFGDDAFGCEVAAELAKRPLPDGVNVRDFGIRSYDFAYAMMDDYEHDLHRCFFTWRNAGNALPDRAGNKYRAQKINWTKELRR